MSKEGKSLVGGFGAGGDVTSQTILAGLVAIGENLGMITEVRDALGMTSVDLAGFVCRLKGYDKLASVYEFIGKSFRVNMCSKDRKRALEIIEGFKAVYLEEMREKKGKDDLLGGGRR